MEGKNDSFLKPLGVRVTKESVEPHGDEDTWSDAIAKGYEANAKAQYTLTHVLNDDDLSRLLIANRLMRFEII